MLRDDDPSDERPPAEVESQATNVEPGADAVYGDWREDHGPPAIVARVDGRQERLSFDATFTIGRGDICDLRVESAQVSRVHSEVFWANRRWGVRDLGSTNGTFLEGARIEAAELGPRNAVRLGAKGPVVWLDVEGAASDPPSLAHYLRRYVDGDLISRAAAAFDRVDLPPQYAVVALQESDFRLDACGPKTRYGIAKGPWQFIPPTARAYGLRVGPLFLERRPDPEDERHDFDRSSDAAARYTRDIYVREAQGSGLLVLAIYNHGGSNIRRMLRSLPETPAARNFWRVLLDHRDRFPTETYDYILRILSAAVVLEDPARFGFDFPSPIRRGTPSTTQPAT